MDLEKAVEDLLAVYANRIERLLGMRVAKRGKVVDANQIVSFLLEWGMINPDNRFIQPRDRDEILFLQAIVNIDEVYIPYYIPVSFIDLERKVFTDDQLCRQKPDVP